MEDELACAIILALKSLSFFIYTGISWLSLLATSFFYQNQLTLDLQQRFFLFSFCLFYTFIDRVYQDAYSIMYFYYIRLSMYVVLNLKYA